MGWQELYEIQQGQMQSPPPRKEEPLAAIGWILSGWGEALQKGPGSPGKQPADRKPAVHPGSEEGQKPPELYEWEHSQLIEIIYFSPLFSTFKMVCRILCLVWDPQNKEDLYKLSEFGGGSPRWSVLGALGL